MKFDQVVKMFQQDIVENKACSACGGSAKEIEEMWRLWQGLLLWEGLSETSLEVAQTRMW